MLDKVLAPLVEAMGGGLPAALPASGSSCGLPGCRRRRLAALDFGENLVENFDNAVQLRPRDRERWLHFEHIAQAGVLGRAEDDAKIHRPAVDLECLGGRRFLRLLIPDQLDADEQA